MVERSVQQVIWVDRGDDTVGGQGLRYGYPPYGESYCRIHLDEGDGLFMGQSLRVSSIDCHQLITHSQSALPAMRKGLAKRSKTFWLVYKLHF